MQRPTGRRPRKRLSAHRPSAPRRAPARSAHPRASMYPFFCCWPCCWRWAASSCSGIRAASRVTVRHRAPPLPCGWRRLSRPSNSQSLRSRTCRPRPWNRSCRLRRRSRSCQPRKRTKSCRRRRRTSRRRLLRPAWRQARPSAHRRQLATGRPPPLPPPTPRARRPRPRGTWARPERAPARPRSDPSLSLLRRLPCLYQHRLRACAWPMSTPLSLRPSPARQPAPTTPGRTVLRGATATTLMAKPFA